MALRNLEDDFTEFGRKRVGWGIKWGNTPSETKKITKNEIKQENRSEMDDFFVLYIAVNESVAIMKEEIRILEDIFTEYGSSKFARVQ